MKLCKLNRNLLKRVNRRYDRKFTEVLVPDYELTERLNMAPLLIADGEFYCLSPESHIWVLTNMIVCTKTAYAAAIARGVPGTYINLLTFRNTLATDEVQRRLSLELIPEPVLHTVIAKLLLTGALDRITDRIVFPGVDCEVPEAYLVCNRWLVNPKLFEPTEETQEGLDLFWRNIDSASDPMLERWELHRLHVFNDLTAGAGVTDESVKVWNVTYPPVKRWRKLASNGDVYPVIIKEPRIVSIANNTEV